MADIPGGVASYGRTAEWTHDHTKVDSTLFDKDIFLDETNTPTEFSDSNDSNRPKSDGGDIVFGDSDGSNWRNLEITVFEQNAVPANANIEMFFRRAILSSIVDQKTSGFWKKDGQSQPARNAADGGSEGVWKSTFVKVHHLHHTPDSPNISFIDSTSNNNDGASVTAASTLVDTPMGKGQDFGGPGHIERIVIPDDNSFHVASAYTFLTRVKRDIAGAVQTLYMIDNGHAGWSSAVFVGISNTNVPWLAHSNGSSDESIFGSSSVPLGSYFTYGFRYVGGGTVQGEFVIDGVTDGGDQSLRVPVYDGAEAKVGATIGLFWDGFTQTNGFDGIVDELQVADTDLGIDWIIASHNNWDSPATFIDAGAVVDVSDDVSDDAPTNKLLRGLQYGMRMGVR